MLTVVDEDIPFAAETFDRFGEVRRVTSRGTVCQALRDADALIVRSVTRVDAALLEGTPVRFVGTATAGIDHIDLRYLRQQGIAFADASGANANAVAEYVVAALFHLEQVQGLDLAHASLGVIGCGHVGRRVVRFATALGLRCVLHDPPLGRSTCEPVYRPLEEALACDVVTVHVPLERGGPDPTHHLVNDTFLAVMKPGAILINTSRGAVADTAALKRAVRSGKLDALVLDVWENEPSIDVDLARACRLATAHIAGHTLDAKIAAVQRLADTFTAHIAKKPGIGSPGGAGNHGGPPLPAIELTCDSVTNAVRAAFDIAEADARLRATLDLPPAERARAFDALRSGWPARREFHIRPLRMDNADPETTKTLRALGFHTSTPAAATGAPS